MNTIIAQQRDNKDFNIEPITSLTILNLINESKRVSKFFNSRSLTEYILDRVSLENLENTKDPILLTNLGKFNGIYQVDRVIKSEPHIDPYLHILRVKGLELGGPHIVSNKSFTLTKQGESFIEQAQKFFNLTKP